MSVRFYVTSAALMICSWLAATYLRAVPMDTYPGQPPVVIVPPNPTVPMVVAQTSEQDPELRISTATR